MTSFRNGRATAHVMEWAGSRDQWESACNRPTLNVKPANWQQQEGWPLRHVGLHERLVPWCSQCVTAVQRQVDRLTADVLDPARQEHQQ